MSMNNQDREDKTIYKVVVNEEEQYSISRVHEKNGLGWREVGKVGSKAECLSYIKEVWTDMTPLSLRKKMAALRNNPVPPTRLDPPTVRESVVDILCKGDHPVVAGLRPERTVKVFKDAIDRGHVHIKFTDTKGGTELGVRLDSERCDFSQANFEAGTGSVHVEGRLTLDYVKVRCIADLSLETLEGSGRLVKEEGAAVSQHGH
jgi:uncharacterized protein YbdZ (MbtH family)